MLTSTHTQDQTEAEVTTNNQLEDLFCLRNNPTRFAIQCLNSELKIRADKIKALQENRENNTTNAVNKAWFNCCLFSDIGFVLAFLCCPCVLYINLSSRMDKENKIKQLSLSTEEQTYINALLEALIFNDNLQKEQSQTEQASLLGLLSLFVLPLTPSVKKSPGEQTVIILNNFLKPPNIVKLRPFLESLMTLIASAHQISLPNAPLPNLPVLTSTP